MSVASSADDHVDRLTLLAEVRKKWPDLAHLDDESLERIMAEVPCEEAKVENEELNFLHDYGDREGRTVETEIKRQEFLAEAQEWRERCKG